MSSSTTLKFILLGVDKVTGPMRTAGSEAQKTGGHLAGMGTKSKVAILGLAGAAGLFAKSSISKFQQVTLESRALQRAMGGTLQQASRYRFAAHEAGVDSEVFTKSMQQLDKRLVAATGSQKAAAAMTKTLGINFRDANGHVKPMSDLLPQIADRFKSMADGPEKTALALKLFGKAGVGMLPFLSKGSSGIAELTKESDKFGLTLNNNAIDAVTKAKVSQRQWGAAMDGLKVQIGAALLPILTKFVDFIRQAVIPFVQQITGWVRQHQQGFQQLGDAIFKVVNGVYRQIFIPCMHIMIPLIRSVVDWIKQHREGIKQLARVLAGVFIGAVRVVIAILKAVIHVIGDIIGVFRDLGQAVVTVWRNVIEPYAAAVGKVWRTIGDGLKWAWNNVIRPIFIGIKTAIGSVRDFIAPIIIGISDAFKGIGTGLKWAWDHTLGWVFQAIQAAIKEVRDAIGWITGIDLSGVAKKGLDKINAKSGQTAADLVNSGPSTVKRNAQGTGWWPGGVTIKDEHGLEAAYLPRGARIATATETASQDRMRNGTRQKPTVVQNYNTVTIIQNNPLGERASISLPAALRSTSATLGGHG